MHDYELLDYISKYWIKVLLKYFTSYYKLLISDLNKLGRRKNFRKITYK